MRESSLTLKSRQGFIICYKCVSFPTKKAHISNEKWEMIHQKFERLLQCRQARKHFLQIFTRFDFQHSLERQREFLLSLKFDLYRSLNYIVWMAFTACYFWRKESSLKQVYVFPLLFFINVFVSLMITFVHATHLAICGLTLGAKGNCNSVSFTLAFSWHFLQCCPLMLSLLNLKVNLLLKINLFPVSPYNNRDLVFSRRW